MLDGREGLVVEELGLEYAKEVLDHTIVITIAFSGHALPDAFIFEHLLIRSHLVMPSLVRMKDQMDDGQVSSGKHCCSMSDHQMEVWGL